MNDSYTYVIEERFYSVKEIGISNEFYETIKNNKHSLIQEKDSVFKFVYVGVMTYKDEVLLVLPKYYEESSSMKKIDYMKLLIKLFRKIPRIIINKNKEALFLSNDIDNEYVSQLALADYLIKDYLNNGYYINKKRYSNLDSIGKIDWNKTIGSVIPIISNSYPIYSNYYSLKTKNNYDEKIHIINRALVDICIKKYGELLGYKIKNTSDINRSISEIKRIGNENEISSIIRNELENVYTDREKNLLKCMDAFFNISNKKTNKNLNLYGTVSFNLIWEYLCGYVFNNEYEKYKNDIPIPRWKKSIEDIGVINDKNLLKPDVVRFYDNKILLLDAKYYLIDLSDNEIKGNPGSYDIVKQYTYEMAIRNKYKNVEVINVLLYPKLMDKNIKLLGFVEFDVFDLKPILNIYLDPNYIINLFLKSERLLEGELNYVVELHNNL